jgi:hypothetical protein
MFGFPGVETGQRYAFKEQQKSVFGRDNQIFFDKSAVFFFLYIVLLSVVKTPERTPCLPQPASVFVLFLHILLTGTLSRPPSEKCGTIGNLIFYEKRHPFWRR